MAIDRMHYCDSCGQGWLENDDAESWFEVTARRDDVLTTLFACSSRCLGVMALTADGDQPAGQRAVKANQTGTVLVADPQMFSCGEW